MSEGLIVVLYMLLIAAGVLAVSALPTTAARQPRREALTDTTATPTPFNPTPRAGGFSTFPPAPFSPGVSIRARRQADRNVRPAGRDRGMGSRRGGRRHDFAGRRNNGRPNAL